ncbi:MAG: GSCFA family protein, partial [Bacteroidetes bacterium]
MNNNLKFRTEIPEWEFPCEINHQTPLFFIGSCFADNISGKLQFYKFPVISNPFGTLYNPASVFNVLKAIETKSVPENLLLHKNELWLHYYFHSSVKNTSKTDFIQNFKKLSQKLSKHLSETKVAFITLGTSYVYELQNVIVGNCHKQPASLFTHRLLTLKETV